MCVCVPVPVCLSFSRDHKRIRRAHEMVWRITSGANEQKDRAGLSSSLQIISLTCYALSMPLHLRVHLEQINPDLRAYYKILR